MLLDYLLKLATNLAVDANDAYGAVSVDLGNVTPKRQVGTGEPISIIVVVKTAAAGDSSSFTDNSDFIAVQSANADLSSHDEIIKRRVAGASLVAGAIIEIPIPVGTPTKRYLGLRVELGTGDTVTIDAYIVPRTHVQAFLAYNNAITP